MLNYRTKNYLLFLLLILFSLQLHAQKTRKALPEKKSAASMKAGAFIDVNVATYTPSTYTIDQLVRNVLISGGSSCAPPDVSNVTVSPNQPHTDTERAWGYFHKGTTNFPFQDGIVLVTGKARRAGNVLEGGLGDSVPGTIGSDPDLVAAINPLAPLNDAVFIEFDFVPNNSQINFNYIFASEEYTSDFPCGNYSDGFALLLKPNTPGSTYTNMAILPGGAGPVSVTNIVPAGSGFSCGPINASYFAGTNSTNVETNFNGRTIPLTATATVVPGQSYHFKMVLADASDSGFDSGVFIQGGSFDLGMTIVDPNGNPVPESLNVCDNTPTLLKAQITALPGTVYQWFKDGVAIPGATSMTYTATTPGVYKVQVTVPGATCPVEAQVTIIGGTSPIVQNATLKLCSTPSNFTFNLDSAKPLISTTTGAVFKFYLALADAIAGNASNITGTTAFNGTDGQVIYVNVSNGAFCSKVATLTLRKEETPVATVAATKVKICNGESLVLTASGGVTYQWGDTSVSGAIRTVSPTVTTTYNVYAIGAQGCKSLVPASVTIEVVPAITSSLTGGWICNGDKITLDAGAGPSYSYQWSNGATNQTITVEAGGTYGVTISNGVCSKLFTTEVKIAVPPTITNIDYSNDNITVSVSNPSNGVLEYSLDNGLTWQNSSIFTNVPKNKLVYIQVRVKTTSCVGYLEYYTFNMQNVITPNGDNVNDKIDFRGVAVNKNFTAQVSDRYGRVVYKYEPIRPYWDGFFQGKKLSSSSYWYQITFEDPASKQTTVKTGWILLKNFE